MLLCAALRQPAALRHQAASMVAHLKLHAGAVGATHLVAETPCLQHRCRQQVTLCGAGAGCAVCSAAGASPGHVPNFLQIEWDNPAGQSSRLTAALPVQVKPLVAGPVRAAKGLCIGDRSFGSQKEAKSFTSDLLRGLTGQTVRPGDLDFSFLCALLERHPNYTEKVQQPPVAAFFVAVNEFRGLQTGRELRFKDMRDVWTPVSVQTCITYVCCTSRGRRASHVVCPQ